VVPAWAGAVNKKEDNMETSMEINGVRYIRADSVLKTAEERDGMPYVIVRTYSAGVFAGYLESRNGKEGVMRDARRIWYWAGAASLSQLAVDGTSKPADCKFPVAVDRIELTEIIEVLSVTEKAKASIASVPIWKR
jgi:hypothetical protein